MTELQSYFFTVVIHSLPHPVDIIVQMSILVLLVILNHVAAAEIKDLKLFVECQFVEEGTTEFFVKFVPFRSRCIKKMA